MKTVGSKREVYNGTADHTAGGLKKADLKENRHGKVVSRKQSAAAARRFPMMKAALLRGLQRA